jgi:hypothetical protein
MVDQKKTIAYLEKLVRRQGIQITDLKAQQAEQDHPVTQEAMEVARYWRDNIRPGARELNSRCENVEKRLRGGYSIDELKRAIDGYTAKPFVTNGQRASRGTGKRYDELELICRTPMHVDAGIAIVDALEEDTHPELDERQLRAYQHAMKDEVAERLCSLRGWSPVAIKALGLGLDGGRVVFPVRSSRGRLIGLQRYAPNATNRRGPKMLAEGARDLFPAPESVDEKRVWLVEGEPDAVAALSVGIPAIGVPGVSTWKEGWAQRFSKFERVYVCFDCDVAGREAASAREASIGSVTRATLVDLEPMRSDSYDIGDLVRERGKDANTILNGLAKQARKETGVMPLQPRLSDESPFDRVVRELQARNLFRSKSATGQVMAGCPAHDDRHPSLSVGEGTDGRVLLHCHTGCDPTTILGSIGMSWTDAFPVGL